MELRQPRGFGNEGRKTTHDFLSLYSPPAQQDPRPPPQGGFLKTHNFLQPLEQDVVAKDEDIIEIKDDEEKPPLNVEHILPGGIGTYSITYFNERFPKPEGSVYMMAQATSSTNMNDDNSNCSSYTGSGFTLWDEPAGKKGQTGKENYFAGDRPVLREAGVNGRAGDWPTSLERPTQSSSNHIPSTRSFSSPSFSQPSTAQNHSFLNMLTSAKSVQEEEDDDDEEEEDIIIKKEPSPHPKGPFALKADGRSTDQKPSTPRSKHSATEQRRRSKINDRLQKLREIIPHGDQKRDRASFLLEVIEYIQFLQEKVHKYEGTYPGWNQDGPKLTPWRNPGATEDLVNSAHLMKMAMNPALLLPSKLDGKKFGTSPLHPINGQHLVHEAELSSPSIFRERVPQPEPVNMATASIPSSKRPSVFPFGGSNIETRPVSEPERTVPQSQFWLRDPLTADCNATDKLKDQELAIESGTINISSIYSQGLFSTLTQALQSSGIDLSQANISVQIDLGKKGSGRVDSSASAVKDTGMPLNNNQEMPRSSITRTGEDCSAQQAVKRFKSCRS